MVTLALKKGETYFTPIITIQKHTLKHATNGKFVRKQKKKKNTNKVISKCKKWPEVSNCINDRIWC